MCATFVPENPQIIPDYEDSKIRPRLSLTSDILDYRHCRRKYGLYKVRRFSPSSPAAEFVGTFGHRSVEHAWRHFVSEGHAPSNAEMVELMEEIRHRMVNEEGRRPHSWHAVFRTGCQVMRLNRTLSELRIYPDVVDCERTLRVAQEDYMIEGIVDMILSTDGAITLWDFKAANDPRRILNNPVGSERSKRAVERILNDNALQLRLYHYLYQSTFQEFPTRCQLVFLGEIDIGGPRMSDYSSTREAWMDFHPKPIPESRWEELQRGASSSENPGLLYSVSTDPDRTSEALEEFNRTAISILSSRRQDIWPAPPFEELPRKQTCNDCDFLRSCPTAWPVRSS